MRVVLVSVTTLALVVVLFVVLRPDDEAASLPSTTSTGSSESTPTATEPAPTTTAAAPAAPAGPTRVRITVRNGRVVGGLEHVTVSKGDRVELIVVADVSDEIHLHGYDRSADVAPGAPARLRFRATLVGRFEVELEERKQQIAEIEVEP